MFLLSGSAARRCLESKWTQSQTTYTQKNAAVERKSDVDNNMALSQEIWERSRGRQSRQSNLLTVCQRVKELLVEG